MMKVAQARGIALLLSCSAWLFHHAGRCAPARRPRWRCRVAGPPLHRKPRSSDANGTVVPSTPATKLTPCARSVTHAQERYFEMDLMRRVAAGELSTVSGRSPSIPTAQLRALPACVAANLDTVAGAQRPLLQAYVDGASTPACATSRARGRARRCASNRRSGGSRTRRWNGWRDAGLLTCRAAMTTPMNTRPGRSSRSCPMRCTPCSPIPAAPGMRHCSSCRPRRRGVADRGPGRPASRPAPPHRTGDRPTAATSVATTSRWLAA